MDTNQNGNIEMQTNVAVTVNSPYVHKQEATKTSNKNEFNSERNELIVYSPEKNSLKEIVPNRKVSRSSNAADMELSWRDITIVAPSLNKKKGVEKKDITILDKVSGRVKSGECLAIIGASGAGKTTLLNYLSRKIESKVLKITGDVLLNNQKIDNHKFSLIASYVMQDDILEAVMTPVEILLFTAKLKLSLPHDQIELRVHQMIEHLHLTKCQHTRVGSNLQRGVSGGERKRTSIGVELISDPKIIFLDEPTTGLDSYNAYEVIQLLRQLSEMGKIIVFTIHQPSSEIFDLLDKLCIMALGKTVFFGHSNKSFSCFESYNLKMPLNYNPFEHFMEMTNISVTENKEISARFPELDSMEIHEKHPAFIKILNEKFEKDIELYGDTYNPIEGFSEENLQLFKNKNQSQNFFYQFAMIFGRNILIAKRNPGVLIIKVFTAILTGFLLAILFVRVTKDFSGVQDRLGIVLNCIVHVVFGAITSTILTFGLLNFLSMGGTSWAFFIGCLANNPEALVNINTALTIPLLILSGFFANADNFAPYLIPIKYLSYFKYGFQTIVHNEFWDLQPLNCQNLAGDICSPMANRFTFLEPFYVTLILIAAVSVFLNICSFLMLYFFAKIRV